MPPVIDRNRCTVCGICVEVCPGDVMAMDGEPVVAYPEECWHCGACFLDCPEDAISIHVPVSMMLATAPPA